MADFVMTFGRHVGTPTSEMPLRYLLWAASSLATPPECVVEELKRRASMHGSREAVDAAAAVSSLTYRGATKRRKGRRRKNRSAKRSL